MRSRVFSATSGYILVLVTVWVALCFVVVTKESDHSLQLRLISVVLPFICLIVFGLFFQRVKRFFLWVIILLLPADMYLVWVVGDKTLGYTWFSAGVIGLLIGMFLLQYQRPVPKVTVEIQGAGGEDVPPLKLREMKIYAKEVHRSRDRLFRAPVTYEEICVYVEIKERTIRFTASQFEPDRVERLMNFPQHFIAGTGPFLSGFDFPDSLIAEIAEKNLVPAGCLIVTDGDNLVGTIYPDEVPVFQQWVLRVFH
ncbi:hypothetical protein [Arcanobacterium pinnipediorum]|uniref:Uncharacterized protein n=1 Tax=Arcanobacterium pinnipediorum TaxID=1503041 RepID=A0ABY5AHP2_9ACTO|nr:hypothetical protein [Arcanobacterium pinnipediorum]USR79377.1 hypothetical protein NG665_08415 [Arcanobacterium pinnipediorum]